MTKDSSVSASVAAYSLPDIDSLLEDDFFEEAKLACEEALAVDESVEVYEKLMRACFNLSEHHLCKKYADRLRAILGPRVRDAVTCEYAREIGHRILAGNCPYGSHQSLPFDVVRTLLNGNYFDDIYTALSYSVQMYECATSEDEAYFAINQIGHCLSYMGGDPELLGLRLMEYSLEFGLDGAFHEEKMIHLMIGYSYVEEYHLAKVIRDLVNVDRCPSFYRPIFYILDVLITSKIASVDKLEAKVTAIFKIFGEYEKSSVFLQIYGSIGLVKALRGDRRATLEAIAKAKVNADHCGSPLNYMLYYRGEAMATFALKDYKAAAKAAENYYKERKRYGPVQYLDAAVQAISDELSGGEVTNG